MLDTLSLTHTPGVKFIPPAWASTTSLWGLPCGLLFQVAAPSFQTSTSIEAYLGNKQVRVSQGNPSHCTLAPMGPGFDQRGRETAANIYYSISNNHVPVLYSGMHVGFSDSSQEEYSYLQLPVFDELERKKFYFFFFPNTAKIDHMKEL